MTRYYDMDKLAEMLRAKADTLIEGKEAFLYVAKWLDLLPADGVAPSGWISVDEGLPEDGQKVLIYDGNAYQWEPHVSCAIFQKGKTAEQLKREGYRVISGADEGGNNMKPYRWCAENGPMIWFGQMVTHWMPSPEAPKMEGGE